MRVCSGPGCLRKIDDDVRFCDECKPKSMAVPDDGIRKHTTAYDAELDALRKGTRWQRARPTVLRIDPLCKRCDRAVSEIVDHIVPACEVVTQAQVSGAYRTDEYAGYVLLSNLQGLCRPCHWVKTNEDKTHTGP